MGVHHFNLSMVPRAYFERSGLSVPLVLTEEDIDRGESAGTGWWSLFQPTPQAMMRLRRLCPVEKSFGETEEFVTTKTWGSDLRIWKEQGRVWLVTFRFSPTTDDRDLLGRFVAIARDEFCLLLDLDTRSLFEPDDKVVVQHLRGSRAMRFVHDPQSTIIDAAEETPQ